MKTPNDLKLFISEKTESINTIGITDSIDEQTLSEICEQYYELKQQLVFFLKKGEHFLTINSFDNKKSLTIKRPQNTDLISANIGNDRVILFFYNKELCDNYSVNYWW